MVKSWMRYIGLLCSIILAIVFIAWVAMVLVGARSLKKELALWETAGGAALLAEINPDPPLSDNENAAHYYRLAIDSLPDLQTEELEPILTDPSEAESIAPLIEACADSLSYMRQAMSRGQWDWFPGGEDVDAIGLTLDFEFSGGIRMLAKMIRAEAEFHAQNGDYDRVEESILNGFHLARVTVDSSPNLVTALVSVAIEQLCFAEIEMIYRDVEMPDSILFSVKARLGRGALIKKSILGEARWGEALLNDTSQQTAAAPIINGYIRNNSAAYLRLCREAADHFQPPFSEQEPYDVEARVPSWAVMADALVPAFDRFNHVVHQSETRAVMLQDAVRLRAHRAERGQYPPSDDFDPAIDPFTGEPLIYARTETGFVLTSEATTGNGEVIEWWWN